MLPAPSFPQLPLVWDPYDDAGASLPAGAKVASARLREDIPLRDWAVLVYDIDRNLLLPKYACGTPDEAATSAAYLTANSGAVPAAVAKVAAERLLERIRWAPAQSVQLTPLAVYELEGLAALPLSAKEAADVSEGHLVKVALLPNLFAGAKALGTDMLHGARGAASRLAGGVSQAGEKIRDLARGTLLRPTAVPRAPVPPLAAGAPHTVPHGFQPGEMLHPPGGGAQLPTHQPTVRQIGPDWRTHEAPLPAIEARSQAEFDAAYRQKYPALYSPSPWHANPANMRPPALPANSDHFSPEGLQRLGDLLPPRAYEQVTGLPHPGPRLRPPPVAAAVHPQDAPTVMIPGRRPPPPPMPSVAPPNPNTMALSTAPAPPAAGTFSW